MNEYIRRCPSCNIELNYSRESSKNMADKNKTLCAKCGHKNQKKYNVFVDNNRYYTYCFKCNDKMFYSTHNGVKYAIKNNVICKKCKSPKITIYNRRCPDCDILIETKNKYFYLKSEKENSKCLSCSLKGRVVTDKTKKLMSINHANVSGKNNPFYGKNHLKETKEKISKSISPLERKNRRIRCIKRISKTGMVVNYSKTACKYFDDLSLKNGWDLKHALNGGEKQIIGYFLDSYDESKNIVVEYDEKKHYSDVNNNILKEKDVIRQNEIIKTLNCKFYRYNEHTDTLYEVNKS